MNALPKKPASSPRPPTRYSTQWTMMPFWLLDPEDTSILSGRLKIFFRFLLIDALKRGQQALHYEASKLCLQTGLELRTARNYLEVLQRKHLVASWSYNRQSEMVTVTLPEHHRLYWVPQPLAAALTEDQQETSGEQ